MVLFFIGFIIGVAATVFTLDLWAKLRRQSDNAVIAPLSARSSNWIRATLSAGGEVVNLYQFGNTWAGKNAAGQFVTLKKL